MHPDRRPNPDRSPEALERSLRALPQPPVPAGLEARLLASIPAAMPVSRRRWVVWMGVAGAVAAACLVAVISWHARNGKSLPEMVIVQPVPLQAPLDAGGITSWREARRAMDGVELPAFAWPLEETSPITVFTSIRPDFLD